MIRFVYFFFRRRTGGVLFPTKNIYINLVSIFRLFPINSLGFSKFLGKWTKLKLFIGNTFRGIT
jgi:hypothetical protein